MAFFPWQTEYLRGLVSMYEHPIIGGVQALIVYSAYIISYMVLVYLCSVDVGVVFGFCPKSCCSGYVCVTLLVFLKS